LSRSDTIHQDRRTHPRLGGTVAARTRQLGRASEDVEEVSETVGRADFSKPGQGSVPEIVDSLIRDATNPLNLAYIYRPGVAGFDPSAHVTIKRAILEGTE
jgi:hypothetical protein